MAGEAAYDQACASASMGRLRWHELARIGTPGAWCHGLGTVEARPGGSRLARCSTLVMVTAWLMAPCWRELARFVTVAARPGGSRLASFGALACFVTVAAWPVAPDWLCLAR